MLQTISSQPELRNLLDERAGRYSPDQITQQRLIDQTITAACANPDLVDEPDIKLALFRVMHCLWQSHYGSLDKAAIAFEAA